MLATGAAAILAAPRESADASDSPAMPTTEDSDSQRQTTQELLTTTRHPRDDTRAGAGNGDKTGAHRGHIEPLVDYIPHTVGAPTTADLAPPTSVGKARAFDARDGGDDGDRRDELTVATKPGDAGAAKGDTRDGMTTRAPLGKHPEGKGNSQGLAATTTTTGTATRTKPEGAEHDTSRAEADMLSDGTR